MTTTSQYRLIAYRDGAEVAKSSGGDPVRGMFENFLLESADIVELWERKDDEKRFRRVAVRSELSPFTLPDSEVSLEALRIANVAVRHFPVPSNTDEFKTALVTVFEAGVAFGRAGQ